MMKNWDLESRISVRPHVNEAGVKAREAMMDPSWYIDIYVISYE